MRPALEGYWGPQDSTHRRAGDGGLTGIDSFGDFLLPVSKQEKLMSIGYVSLNHRLQQRLRIGWGHVDGLVEVGVAEVSVMADDVRARFLGRHGGEPA